MTCAAVIKSPEALMKKPVPMDRASVSPSCHETTTMTIEVSKDE
jgi:hypothetical protein